MKTSINIPTPCTEDWNKMTPTDKGAFCDKCAFEVIDFTKQSPEEIRTTLKTRMGQKTCGHISKQQMQLVNTNYHVWENQSVTIFRSKFLYACMMVFGAFLFTGCGGSEENEEDRVGLVDEVIDGGMDIDVGMIEEDTTYQCDDVVEGEMMFDDSDYEEDEPEVMGKIEEE